MSAESPWNMSRAERAEIQRAMDAPMLEPEVETDLARRWANDRDIEAMHQLVLSHSRLAFKIAAQYSGYGLPISDLAQEGQIGLMLAIERFDPERGVRLSTYAGWWIKAKIQEYVLRNWSIVRIGTNANEKTLFFKLRRLKAKLAAVSLGQGNSADTDSIAEQLKMDPQLVATMDSRLSSGDLSLNSNIDGEDGQEWQDLLEDDGPNPESLAMGRIDSARQKDRLLIALQELPARERRIIQERHLTDEGRTLKQLGAEFGISRERVRQLEQRSLNRLYARLSDDDPTPAALEAEHAAV